MTDHPPNAITDAVTPEMIEAGRAETARCYTDNRIRTVRLEEQLQRIYTAMNQARAVPEGLMEAHDAYNEGYRNGFFDAHLTDGEQPDEAQVLSRIDGVAMSEGWEAYNE